MQDQLHALRAAESAGQHVPQGDGAAADQFHRRVTALKEEFRDLLAELQRRRSTPDGSTVVYEVSPTNVAPFPTTGIIVVFKRSSVQR